MQGMSKHRPTSKIDSLIIHCADTPNGAHWQAEDIDDWHKSRLFKRNINGNVSPHLKHIGYHYVIETTGTIRRGRALDETGAHAKGHNTRSIGICLIGYNKFTRLQWQALQGLISSLQIRFKKQLKVIGHRDVDSGKTCPGFDVSAWLKSPDGIPEQHLLTPNHLGVQT